MTINVWIDGKTGEYKIRHEGETYTRTDYTAAKDLIDSFLCEATIKYKNDRLDRTLYAA